MTKKNQDFEMYQSTAKILTVPVVDENDAPLNLTDATIYYGVFTAKGVGAAVIEKDGAVSGGITLVNSAGTNDALRIAIDEADTNDLLSGRYYHECRVTLNGQPQVVFEGRIRLKKSKTTS